MTTTTHTVTCEDCGGNHCTRCRDHYCCEPCPCDMSHACLCACEAYETFVAAH